MDEETNYKYQRFVSDTFNPQIIEILKSAFGTDDVTVAPLFADCNLGADFIVKKNNRKKEQFSIAARIRNFEYLLKYPDDFTIRADTEISKIRSGLSDYMIYGFADPFNTKIISYRILDLDLFRKSDKAYDGRLPIQNNDNGYNLLVFNVNEFETDLVIEEVTINRMQIAGYQQSYNRYRIKIENEIKARYRNTI